MNSFFVTGIGTGVGKTVASAVLVQALGAGYWKPVQSGFEEGTDAETLSQLVTHPSSIIFPSTYNLKLPASPHIAARQEGIRIELDRIRDHYHEIRQQFTDTLIIEGAGGLMVPLNEQAFILDLIAALGSEVILVSRNYLGSINHSLLTARQLQSSGIPVRGWVFVDEFMHYEEEISAWTGIPILARIPLAAEVNRDFIQDASQLVNRQIIPLHDKS